MLQPEIPSYDIEDWQRRPFAERMRMVCQSWAVQGYGSPLAIFGVYALKIVAYIAGWAFFCTFSAGQDAADIGTWWASREAFTKAILWTTFFEGLGLGCGSGPLAGRYMPPLGGPLYFLRPGTTKLPFIQDLPLFGGTRRTWFDVSLYALHLGLLLRALVAPEVTAGHLAPLLVTPLLMGLADKTLFLMFRSEHYLSAIICLLFIDDWITGSKWIWVAIWWWAATSKLNYHFPAVMCVMVSNSPWTGLVPGLRERMYVNYPDDLRPSTFASTLTHSGTVLEYTFPLLLIFGDGGFLTMFGLFVTIVFHLFIVSNVPMGVPLEWNFTMIYGAAVLFGVHADVPIWTSVHPVLVMWLVCFHILLPLFGSIYPRWVSFLLSMRYYAGNWAWSVWLFKPEALEKFDRTLVKSSPLITDQLRGFYDENTVQALMSKVMAFRAMHLHGRTLRQLVPLATDDIDAYTWLDGELVAGMAIGWNFGDGHLHHEQLMNALQEQCGFEPGDVRAIFVESQPLFDRCLSYKVVDAADGERFSGRIRVGDLTEMQPWPDAADTPPAVTSTT